MLRSVDAMAHDSGFSLECDIRQVIAQVLLLGQVSGQVVCQ